MSEPKRYDPPDTLNGESFMQEIEGGDYIRYEDYARLKAECQARQAENSVLAVECDSLKAEVERLRKAGDAVSLCLEAYWKGKPYDVSMTIECFDAWNAAKEGKV